MQLADMGRALYESEPTFRSAIKQCSSSLDLVPSLEEAMYGSSTALKENPLYLSSQVIYEHLNLFALEVALVFLWRSRGISPAVVCGHSIGEYAAAVAAGILSIENAAKLVYLRAISICEYSEESAGAMVAVRGSEEQARAAITRTLVENADTTHSARTIALGAVNGPQSIVLSGDVYGVAAVLAEMAPTSFKYLPLGLAYHTSLLRSAAASFKTRVMNLARSGTDLFSRASSDNTIFVSCLTGKVEPPERILSIDYWIEQMLSEHFFFNFKFFSISFHANIFKGCVRFGACIETVKSDSTLKAIVEIGPSDALIRICMSWIDSDSIRFLSTLQGNKNCVESFNVAVENISSQINSAASALSTGTLMRWRWRRVNNGIDGGICSLVPSPEQHDNLLETVRREVFAVLNFKDPRQVSDDTSFLALGLDSLGAIALRHRLSQTINCPELASSVIFEYSTIRTLVEFLSKEISNDQKIIASSSVLEPKSRFGNREEETFDTLHMQRNMIFHSIASPHQNPFLETFCWDLGHKDVDCDVLYEAWCDTVAEHEALRLSFDPFAVPSPTQRLWKYSSIEHLKESSRCSNWFKVYHFDSEQSDEQVDSCVQCQRELCFDIESPLLYSIFILNFKEKMKLILTIHHLLVDGTSIKKILHSLDKYYLNRITSSSPYSDRNLMSSGAYFPAVMEDLNTKVPHRGRAEEYWRNLLSGFAPFASHIKGPALVIDALDDEVSRENEVLLCSLLISHVFCRSQGVAS